MTRIEIKRYDRLESRYLSTGDYSALQQMNMEYPIETKTLIEKVLQIGSVYDPDIGNKFLRFYQDPILQTLIADVTVEYANMDDVNKGLNRGFAKLNDWLPDLSIPFVYTQIGALAQSIIIGDHSIGICLDKYMGVNYPIYAKYYTLSQRKSMARKNIVPDCILFYLISMYPLKNFDSRTQLEKDLHTGKLMWVVNKALGNNIYKTKYVSIVDVYMKKHASMPIIELIGNEDQIGILN